MKTKKMLFKLNRECACGCGQIIEIGYSAAQKYLPGHNNESLKKVKRKRRIPYSLFIKHYDRIRSSFEKKLVKVPGVPHNMNVKGNCITTRVTRGWINRNSKKYRRFGFKIDGIYYSISIHHLATMLYIGEIPRGKQVNHHCDCHMCCNPKHLYIGTRKDNMHDMCNRRGEDYNLHLSRLEVNSILYHLQSGEDFQDIAKAIGCSPTTVHFYNNGEAYLTTTGEEVLGKDYEPIPITERRMPSIGGHKSIRNIIVSTEEVLDLGQYMKERIEQGAQFESVCKELGVSDTTGRRYLQLANAMIKPKYYKLGLSKLYQLLDEGKNLKR